MLNSKNTSKNFVVVIHVRQTTPNLIISRCHFVDNGKNKPRVMIDASAQSLHCSLNLFSCLLTLPLILSKLSFK